MNKALVGFERWTELYKILQTHFCFTAVLLQGQQAKMLLDVDIISLLFFVRLPPFTTNTNHMTAKNKIYLLNTSTLLEEKTDLVPDCALKLIRDKWFLLVSAVILNFSGHLQECNSPLFWREVRCSSEEGQSNQGDSGSNGEWPDKSQNNSNDTAETNHNLEERWYDYGSLYLKNGVNTFYM